MIVMLPLRVLRTIPSSGPMETMREVKASISPTACGWVTSICGPRRPRRIVAPDRAPKGQTRPGGSNLRRVQQTELQANCMANWHAVEQLCTEQQKERESERAITKAFRRPARISFAQRCKRTKNERELVAPSPSSQRSVRLIYNVVT